MDVSLQLIAFREPEITRTMDAWADQPTPDWANVSYEAWVTPSDDPKHRCGTWMAAKDHAVFSAREAPQYKLRARNEAHEAAVGGGADGFISCDVDAPPLSEDTLTNLLRRLRDPSVSAASANPVAPLSGPAGVRANVGVYLKEAIGGIHGQCAAISADGWRCAGPIGEPDDHTQVMSVLQEEELAFGRRLAQCGRLVRAYDAPVENDTRRLWCKLYRGVPGKSGGGFCRRAEGSETFAPFRRR